MQPQIISSYEGGRHNADLDATVSRLERAAAYKDLSTVMIVPALGTVPTKAVAAWMNMYAPPNQKFTRLWALAMEVGDAYSRTIEAVLAHPDLSQWKYILTLEHDNIPPPDGLVSFWRAPMRIPNSPPSAGFTSPRARAASRRSGATPTSIR